MKEQDMAQDKRESAICSKNRQAVEVLQNEILFVLLVFVFFIIGRHFLVHPKEMQLEQAEKRIQALREQKLELQKRCVDLSNRINAARYDPFFIEEAARDVLRLVRKGETLLPPLTNDTAHDKVDTRDKPSPSCDPQREEMLPR
ncbi:MAG: septum formation initiator family protein [Planctomycetota bacterium]|nr:septum formation initiator family protein [Planctomycetota bacterium]